jgi:hypothetical protein
MNLVKTIRKHQRKIMTVVVIVLMIAFVGGYAFQYLMARIRLGNMPVMATYDDGKEIKADQIRQAQSELKLLRALRMDYLLMLKPSMANMPDFRAQLLGQLIFPDTQASAAISQQMKQMISQGRLSVDQKKINKFFQQLTDRSDVYWILLKNEARNAGIIISRDQARTFLKQTIPAITQNQATAAQLVASVAEGSNLTEDQIMDIVAELLGVLTYAETVTKTNAVTINQIKSMLALNAQALKVTHVQINAEDLVDEDYKPSQQQIDQQFSKWKNHKAGEITDQNPHAFGYMLPARAQIEYIIINLDDVKKLIDKVTPAEAENFYRQNIDRFTYQQPVDPNNPQGEKVTKTYKYSEIASQVRKALTMQRVQRRAELIMNDVRDLAEKGFASINIPQAQAQQLKEKAADYNQIAQKVSKDYNIQLLGGKTGMLSYEQFKNDRILSQIQVPAQTRQQVPLAKIVFSAGQLDVTALGRFERAEPKLWENIGPARGMITTPGQSEPTGFTSLVRVINTSKPKAPDTVDTSYSIKTINLDKDTTIKAVYSVKDQVIKDIRLEKAMEKASQKAQKLLAMVNETGWEKAIQNFNEKFGTENVKYSIQQERNYTSSALADIVRAQNIAAGTYAQRLEKNRMLYKKFNDLVPPQKNLFENVNTIVTFKPDFTSYIVKDISRKLVDEDQYLRSKSQIAYMINAMNSDSLAIEHFMPENLLERMNFKRNTQSETENIQEKNQNQS